MVRGQIADCRAKGDPHTDRVLFERIVAGHGSSLHYVLRTVDHCSRWRRRCVGKEIGQNGRKRSRSESEDWTCVSAVYREDARGSLKGMRKAGLRFADELG